MSRSSAQIPVIDISPSNPHAATQLLDAAANNGFVFVENNAAAGMPAAKVKNMFDLVNHNAFHEWDEIVNNEVRAHSSFKVRLRTSRNVLHKTTEDGSRCSRRPLILVTRR